MSDQPIIAVPLSDVAVEVLVAELRRRGGYRITSDDGKGWVSPSQASRAVGKHGNWLCKRLHKGARPPGLETDYAQGRNGRRGRLLRVRISQEFKEWVDPRTFHPKLPL